MSKMKVHPAICMKTKERIKLGPVKSTVSRTGPQKLARGFTGLAKGRRRRAAALHQVAAD
jgi:hypothetical protein